ncbi:MAG: IS982 family transposase, partial [Methyloprofundus sp.]|nr:IS982 family transposase [Methyloprofundus sp.]
DVVEEMTLNLHGLLIGDKGYIRPQLKDDLAQRSLDLETPLRKNMKETRPKDFVHKLMKTRRRVETVIGQLVERFHIETVWARDIFHLTNRFTRKLLSHTVGVFLNMLLGREALQFESLVEI